jgi:hypothetical protein
VAPALQRADERTADLRAFGELGLGQAELEPPGADPAGDEFELGDARILTCWQDPAHLPQRCRISLNGPVPDRAAAGRRRVRR